MRYAFEDFELDTELFELRRAGQPVALEPQVFDVLAYLVEQHERVVRKDELIERIWPEKYISEAALNSRLMAARKAIGDSGREQRLIRTLHGRGYRFVGSLADVSAGAQPVQVRPIPAADPSRGLIGRSEEMAVLEAAFREALGGRRQTLFVAGEPGIGKTALVSGFLEEVARPSGAVVAEGLCVEHFGIGEAYEPVFDALSRLARGSAATALAAMLRERAPSWLVHLPWLVSPSDLHEVRDLAVGANGERMLREILETIETLASTRPLVLVLEDVHWADNSTVALLAALARRQDPAALLVIAIYRPEVLGLTEHPFGAVSRELLLRGLAYELRPAAFGPEQVEAFLRERFGAKSVPEGLADALEEVCNGNPLYLAHLTDAWHAAGAIGFVGDALTWSAGAVQGIPRSLHDLMMLRLDRLTTEEREVLAAAAIAGAEFSAADAAAALGREEEDVEALCDSLSRRDLFISAAPHKQRAEGAFSARYAFGHQLCQEVLYTTHGRTTRARLHRRIGQALEARAGSDLPAFAAQLAYHYTEGQELTAAVRYRRLAADHAMRRGGFQEAVAHLREALRGLTGEASTPETLRAEMESQATLGTALVATNGFGDAGAEPAYLRAIELAERLGDEMHRTGVVISLVALYEFQGRHLDAEAALSRLPGHESARDGTSVPLRNLYSCAAFHRGAFGQSVEQADLGLAGAELSGPDVRWAILGEDPRNGCREWSSHSLWFIGKVDSAMKRVEEAVAAAEQPGRRFALASARTHAARIFQLRREPERCERYAEATVSLAQEHRYSYHEAVGVVLLGWARAQLRAAGGLDLIDRGIALHRATGAAMDRAYFHALLADAAIVDGDEARATAALSEAEAALPEGGFFYEAELYRLRGELASRFGTPGTAAAESAFTEAISIARKQGALALELRGAIGLARLWGPRRGSEAYGLLAPLLKAFEDLGEGAGSPDIEDARQLVAALELD